MTEAEFEKRAEKYSEYVERFARGVVGAENVKVGMIKAYKDGFNAGYSDGYETGKKNERELQCGKKYIESLEQRICSLEAENASFIEENKKLRGQFLELKSKIVDLIYSDENCLDKIIELLDDFELELEEDEE